MKNNLVNVALLTAIGLTITHLQAAENHTDTQADTYIQEDAAENAATKPDSNTRGDEMNLDPIDDEDFVELAVAKGIAEIETAHLALDEGTPKIHDFANQMIQDHTKANSQLKKIARQENLDVADEPSLIDKAKTMMLSLRDGQSFDEAYIKNQINAHEQAIELFGRASQSDNAEIRAFAAETLPKLREHLQMAKDLKV